MEAKKYNVSINKDEAKALTALGLDHPHEAIKKLITLSASVTPGEPNHVSESAGSPFSPVCIWPGIQLWSKDSDGAWIGEDFDCPIRLESHEITAAELSKNHCAKCPILAEHKKLLGVFKRRGITIGERYPHLARGASSYSDAIGWGRGR